MRLTLDHRLASRALQKIEDLYRLGVRRHDIVGVSSETSPDAIATLLALWNMGATTWLMPLREPAEKLHLMAKVVGAKTLSPPLKKGVGGFSLFLGSSETERFYRDVKQSESRTLINTSGSTGASKFVEHTLQQHFCSAQGVNQHVKFDASQTWLLSLPLYHVGGLAILIRTLLADATLIIPEKEKSIEDAICEENPTHVSLVATQLKRLIAIPKTRECIANCRRIMLGGGPVPSWLSDARDLPLIASYGATEMASTWTATSPELGDLAIQGSGKLLASRELKVASDGEICVRGPSLSNRYMGSMARKDADGFYQTNDVGRVDKAGNLHVLGRKDNMFISGGENIHPEEIETALLNCSLVQEAVVVGVRDAKWGERPVAFVRYARPVDGDALRAHLEQMLPRFKIPDRFFDWPDDMPHQLKPSRRDIRQRADALLQ